MTHNNPLQGKVALITGGAKRIGATTAKMLHQAGMDLIVHYHNSNMEAENLKFNLEQSRANSVQLIQANLLNPEDIDKISNLPQNLDVLINNASTFYPTKIGDITQQNWDDLIGTNLKCPMFLSQALAPLLKKSNGSIINMADVYGFRPLKNHPVYSVAKASVIMLTKTLALELAPEIRVNAIAPGAILEPINNDFGTENLVNQTALKTFGNPENIAKAILYLIKDADFTTGQVLTVDGGRYLPN